MTRLNQHQIAFIDNINSNPVSSDFQVRHANNGFYYIFVRSLKTGRFCKVLPAFKYLSIESAISEIHAVYSKFNRGIK